jgi:hypothetical protein
MAISSYLVVASPNVRERRMTAQAVRCSGTSMMAQSLVDLALTSAGRDKLVREVSRSR